MKVLKSLADKLLKSLLFGRFEPIETTLSASSFVHGTIILFSHIFYNKSLLGVNDSLEIFAGSSLVIAGVSVVRSICKDYTQVRRFSMFGQFLSWTLLTVLVLVSPGLPVLVHFGYATLSLIAAFLYLNLSLGVHDD
jgi:hypothetical protein